MRALEMESVDICGALSRPPDTSITRQHFVENPHSIQLTESHAIAI
jgi:hypothetical protein